MKKNRLWAIALSFVLPGAALMAQDDYPLNFEKSQAYTNTARHLDGITLSGSANGPQTISIPAPRLVYTDLTTAAFSARAGEQLTATFNYTGNWMHGFVYLDRGNDGQFDATLNADCTIPEGSDIMAFSYAEANLDSGSGKNSAGTSLSGPNVLNPPAFTLPADLADGFYRMRFKVDWAGIDPGGRMTTSNSILANGGGILDVLINVHGENASLTAIADHGTVTMADGTALTGKVEVPFQQALTLRVHAAEGYALDYLRIRHGHHLDGEQYLHGNRQWDEALIPAYLMQGEEVTLPADYVDGDVEVTAVLAPKQGGISSDTDYPLSFDKDATGLNICPISQFQMTGTQGGTTAWTIDEGASRLYHFLPQQLKVVPGDRVTTTGTATDNLSVYLYIDLNNDGEFTPLLSEDGTPTVSSELVAFTAYNGKNSAGEDANDEGRSSLFSLPEFTINELLPPGMYRARLVTDKNCIDPAGSADIANLSLGDGSTSGGIVDFLLNVHRPTHTLEVFTTNGSLNGATNTGLPVDLPVGKALPVVLAPAANGYVADEVVIRHGHNLKGEQYIHGNRQWNEYSRPAANFTLPADSIDGDVWLTANFNPTDEAEYQLVFSDEFDAEDGTQEDNTKWMRCQRYNATWNRWCSDRPEVIYHEDGKLVARAIPNPDTASDNVPMITGGVKSMGIFGFTYGKVECRARTFGWTGHFPAIWMMPEDQSAGWPSCGEIDIFETIDTENRAWHTVHSHWTWDLNNKNTPQSSFNEGVNLDRYHTYGLEWTESTLRWYVDGKLVATYSKSTDASTLEQGQWPFDKHFHLILNQSVGSGAWAANADVTHTYVTQFDWVRVYQKEGQGNTVNGIHNVHGNDKSNQVGVSVQPGEVRLSSASPATVLVSDMSGRILYRASLDGEKSLHLGKGIYIVNGQKVLVP